MKIFRGKLKKRASLQLSINAIVILILAITLLGLGLGFIKKQFGAVSAKFEEASQEIENELIEKIKTSGELLAFQKIRLVAEKGKPQQFYVGIKNTDGSNKRCYKLNFICVQSLASETCLEEVIVGTQSPGGDSGEGWFTTFSGMLIDPLDVQVLPVKLQIADAPKDSYNMRVELYQNTETDDDCPGIEYAAGYELLTSKQFFLEVR